MPTTEELLQDILSIEKLRAFFDSTILCHLLYRTFPASVDFINGHLNKAFSASEEYTITYNPPKGKVKIPSWLKLTFEVQRKFSVRWERDYKTFLDTDNMVDVEFIPPYSYEAWYPCHKQTKFTITNNDSSTRNFNWNYTFYLIDTELYNKIKEILDKQISKLLPGF